MGAAATPERQAFSPAALDYFSEIAFGSEYGSNAPVIRRWTQDVRIAVHGDPSQADLTTLCDVTADLNRLIGTVEVSVVGSKQNVDLYFVPEKRFSEIASGVVPNNLGFFWTWWDATGSITKAQILISTTDVTQEERNHLIREELTQSLGLMRDSTRYEDSLFYQGWTETQEYSGLDEQLIAMLYLPEVVPGMTVEEALAVIPRG